MYTKLFISIVVAAMNLGLDAAEAVLQNLTPLLGAEEVQRLSQLHATVTPPLWVIAAVMFGLGVKTLIEHKRAADEEVERQIYGGRF